MKKSIISPTDFKKIKIRDIVLCHNRFEIVEKKENYPWIRLEKSIECCHCELVSKEEVALMKLKT